LHLTTAPVDGLAAIVAEDLEVHRAAEIFARSMFRRPMPERLGVKVYEGFTKLTISAEPPSPVQTDGEHLGIAHRVTVAEAPDALIALRTGDDQP
ncbi:MAG: hypothetical protein ACE1Z9_09020, partial [Acidimicrobiia bacterium]